MSSGGRFWPGYATVWRWHFYAGLLCIPFVVWLALTGSVYLFKPQIEAYLDRPYDHLRITGPAASARAQIAAARAAVPGTMLNAYQLPVTPHSAVQILVGRGDQLVRVYVHPQTLAILSVQPEDRRPMELLFHLHGELLLGDRGSMLVELAASWAIVLIVTGLYLWWPRDGRGMAGTLYPRFGPGRIFWRDLHAVGGAWVSAFTLFFLISGLPWAASWGNLLKTVQTVVTRAPATFDWSTGASSETAHHAAANHLHGAPERVANVDGMIANVAALGLAYPVLIAPPSADSPTWTARSDAQNRPQRVLLRLTEGGAIVGRIGFAQRSLIDRIVAVGVAAHEGQLFGWVNQVFGLLTGATLIVVAVSATMMWWMRRPQGRLGAPGRVSGGALSTAIVACVVALGIVLPLLGISLVVILVLEGLVFRHIPAAHRFLGLDAR